MRAYNWPCGAGGRSASLFPAQSIPAEGQNLPREHARFKPENRYVLRLRARIRALMLIDPRVYWLCMPAIRSVKRLSGRLLLLASRTPRDRHLSIDRLLWVSPSQIEFKTLLKGSVFRHMGCGWVIGGDWDRLEHTFARDARFRAMQAVIEESTPWQATDEYTRSPGRHRAGDHSSSLPHT